MKVTLKAGFFNVKKVLVIATIVIIILTVSVIVKVEHHPTLQHVQNGKAVRRNTRPKSDMHFKNGQAAYNYGVLHRSETHTSKKRFCTTHGRESLTPAMLKTVLYNDKYKVVYCAVPKIACTNWERVFLILSGNINTTDPREIHSADVHGKYGKYLNTLSQLPIHEIKFRLDNYYKFTFTRNPFERILSAYLNKFKSYNPYFHSRYGKQIAKRFRINSQNSSSRGDDVTFREFVQYLTDFTRKDSFNGHWRRMTDFCHPCLVNYDFIGSLDNMDVDSDRILKKIGASKVVRFPKRSTAYKHPTTQSRLHKYYRLISPAMLDQLMDVYYSDFLMFNLTIPKSLKNLKVT